jgi:predicted nucleic acid-binding protein
LEALVIDDPDMMVWWGSPVECGSAVHRLRREGVFSPAEAAQVLAGLAGALDAANVVQPGDELCEIALRLLGVHPLRAADALQLAAALLWARGRPAQKDFVCLDERLRTAAILEGFAVLPETV